MRKMCILMALAMVLGWAGGAWADLVGYWPLDGNGKDLSGNGLDGKINGNVAPAADRFGNPEAAMSFAGGGGDNINVGNPPELQMTGAMTITAWVYLDNTSPLHGARNSRIFGKMSVGGKRAWSAGIEKTVGGVPYPATIQIASNASTVVGLNDNTTLPVGQWVHYAGVFTPGQSLEVYVNGTLSHIRTDGIPPSQYAANGESALIGNRPGATDCGWYGFLDEVRMYNEALSQTRIESLMWGHSAGNPDPANGAERVAVNPVLSWRAPDAEWLGDPNRADEVRYVVYFDPNELLVTGGDALVSFGPQPETSLALVGDLDLGTRYYWRVDVVDPNGPTVHRGVVWSFTTVPPKAGLVSPADGAVDVAKNAVLQWDPGFGAVEHDIYFGTDAGLVEAGDASVYIGRTGEVSFDPDLDWQTQYFWRIDEIFSGGAVPERGDVWSFVTGAAICEQELTGDINKDCVVDFKDLVIMVENWLVCNLTNGDCP
ncbi:MAG: LamG domain-containing protein [Phycisphaerae bacterium]|nr:LamG domain-containing protein [Phycisphaerae bacterium]